MDDLTKIPGLEKKEDWLLDRRRVGVFLLSHCTEGHRILWASDMSFVVWSRSASLLTEHGYRNC